VSALTIGNILRVAAGRDPEKIAVCSGRTALSYRELVQRAARLTNAIRAMGIAAGGRVAIVAPACTEYFELVAGISDAGLIAVTLAPNLTGAELDDILSDCAPALMILANDVDPRGSPAICLGEEYERWIARGADTLHPQDIDERSSFAASYTSGTTGTPKAVLLSHRSRALTAIAAASEYGCFGADERFLSMTPLHHGAGLAYPLANLLLGGTVELMPRFDAEAAMTRIGSGDVTATFVVPTMLQRMLDVGGGRGGLNGIICNATACPQPLKERAIETLGEGLLHESYGATELGIVTNIRPAEHRRKPGSVGRSFPLGAIELRGQDGRAVNAGQVGELFCRSPYLFNGYLNRPEETAECLSDGWGTVGDLATHDADGFIKIVGRKKDMIISGGINVYPSEIEAVLARIPGVSDVAAIGLPDAEWGERVHAFIVGETNETSVFAAAAKALSPHKRPKSVSFLSELPRNASGKVLKKDLKKLADTGSGI
jgi:long-chain acyl-CoA synthetase